MDPFAATASLLCGPDAYAAYSCHCGTFCKPCTLPSYQAHANHWSPLLCRPDTSAACPQTPRPSWMPANPNVSPLHLYNQLMLSCAGLMLLRPTAATTAFLAAWESALQAHETAWDQTVFNNLARQGVDLSGGAGSESRLWKGHGGALTVGVLPVASFAGGHTFFVQSLYEVRGDDLPEHGCALALCARFSALSCHEVRGDALPRHAYRLFCSVLHDVFITTAWCRAGRVAGVLSRQICCWDECSPGLGSKRAVKGLHACELAPAATACLSCKACMPEAACSCCCNHHLSVSHLQS